MTEQRIQPPWKHAGMKRMIRAKLGPGGTLDRDKFSRALLAYRNTPTEIPADRQPRCTYDFIHVHAGKYQPRTEWLLTQDDPKRALRRRHLIKGEELTQKTHTLTPLTVGTVISIQNQRGSHAKRWDKSSRGA